MGEKMRHTGLDRRKTRLLDEPHQLNQWYEIARARADKSSSPIDWMRVVDILILFALGLGAVVVVVNL